MAEPGGGVLFSGGLRECEDWLDAAENRQRLAAAQAGSAGRRPRRRAMGRLAGFGATLGVLAVAARAVFAAFRRDRPPEKA